MEKKIYFTYSNEQKEGFVPQVPMTTSILTNESVDEIFGDLVIEKVPDLIAFIEECYRILRPGGKATFASPHYTNAKAWASPLNKRGVSEFTLNFASKDWRDANKYGEAQVVANFEVQGSFALEEGFMQRSEDARQFFMKHYNNVAQAVLLSLTKK